MKSWKIAAIALALTGALLVNAASLTTTTGRVFHNVELKKIAAGRVVIAHEGGKAVIDLSELPNDFIAALSVRQRYALQSMIDLPINDGRLLKRTNIVELGEGCVTFATGSGIVKVTVDLLPAYYLNTFTNHQLEAIKQNQQTSSTSLVNPAAQNVPAQNVPAAFLPSNPVSPGSARANQSAPTGEGDRIVEKDSKGRDIFEGPYGGRYYFKDGKKIYLPRKN